MSFSLGSGRDRAPCLVGEAQAVSRPEDGPAPEPLVSWEQVARDACRAARVDPREIDRLDVVYCQSWQYDDPARRLAGALGASPRHARYSGIGGTTPQHLVDEAAAAIIAGDARVAVIVGAEALDTRRRLRKTGEKPAWSHPHPSPPRFPFEAPFIDTEIAHEVFQAYTTFALRDVARRARLGTPPGDHLASLGELFAPMTKVAAANPLAWFPEERTATELATATPDNRLVAYPYTKRLVSVMDVDLAGALVLTSAATAAELGVPDDERVFLHGWCYGTDPVYPAEHDDLSRSPAMAAVFAEALCSAGAGIDDIAHLDLYSCFPSSVAFALDALDLVPDDRRAPFTVTGGLPYFGGAGSCYVTNAIATMARVLRADPGSLGMVTGVGMHMTKHVAGVWSTRPPAALPAPDEVAVQAGLDARPRRGIVDAHQGAARIAAYTVHHGRDGAATDALLVCDVAPGEARSPRCYAKAHDPGLLAALESDEWVGRDIELVDGGGGVNAVAV